MPFNGIKFKHFLRRAYSISLNLFLGRKGETRSQHLSHRIGASIFVLWVLGTRPFRWNIVDPPVTAHVLPVKHCLEGNATDFSFLFLFYRSCANSLIDRKQHITCVTERDNNSNKFWTLYSKFVQLTCVEHVLRLLRVQNQRMVRRWRQKTVADLITWSLMAPLTQKSFHGLSVYSSMKLQLWPGLSWTTPQLVMIRYLTFIWKLLIFQHQSISQWVINMVKVEN